MRVGFIGLGIMGRPMATHLIDAGHQLTVWNRSRPGHRGAGRGRRGRRRLAGGRGREERDRDHDGRRLAGRRGGGAGRAGHHPRRRRSLRIGGSGRPGLVHIDMSTISPEVTRRIAAEYAKAGVEMLDAPVSGGETGAINATLSIMAGGKREVFERCLPLFEAMGRSVTYCGPSGAGQTVKLCNQVLVSVTNLAVCEALVLAKKAGVSPSTMVEAVSGGAAASWQLLNLGPKMIARDFRPGFKVWHQEKDLRLAQEVARNVALPLPATALVSQLFASVRADGFENEGTQALVKALEKLGDVTVTE